MTERPGNNEGALAALLEEELGLLGEMQRLLRIEREAPLAAGDLQELLTRKQHLMEALDSATGRRTAWLSERGHSPDREGMLACIESLPGKVGLHATFERLGEAARACREDNHVLARVNHQKLQFFSRAVSHVGIVPAPAGDRLYTARGLDGEAAAQHLLGSA